MPFCKQKWFFIPENLIFVAKIWEKGKKDRERSVGSGERFAAFDVGGADGQDLFQGRDPWPRDWLLPLHLKCQGKNLPSLMIPPGLLPSREPPTSPRRRHL